MLKDYDMSVHYHPSKAIVVVDVVCSMTMDSVSNVEEAKKDLVKDVYMLAPFGC